MSSSHAVSFQKFFCFRFHNSRENCKKWNIMLRFPPGIRKIFSCFHKSFHINFHIGFQPSSYTHQKSNRFFHFPATNTICILCTQHFSSWHHVIPSSKNCWLLSFQTQWKLKVHIWIVYLETFVTQLIYPQDKVSAKLSRPSHQTYANVNGQPTYQTVF